MRTTATWTGADERPPRRGRSLRGEDGVTVVWRDTRGEEHVEVEHGHPLAALERIARRIPEGGRVAVISTPTSILRDLAVSSAGRRRRDPHDYERSLLGKIDRLDLLED